MSDEKTYTLKNVRSEIKRIEVSREKKRDKIKQLNAEIKSDSIRLKELESIYDELYRNDLQRMIANAWFKGKKMTGEQITKFLALSTKIQDKIDILDVDKAAEIITAAYDTAPDEQAEILSEAANNENADVDNSENEQFSDNSFAALKNEEV